MKFRSILARLTITTTVLLLVVISPVLAVWLDREQVHIHEQQAAVATALAMGTRGEVGAQLNEKNWAQLRLICRDIARHVPGVLYAIVTDARARDDIAAASPASLESRPIPPMVPLAVTRGANVIGVAGLVQAETFLIDDLHDDAGVLVGRAGEPIVEVAAGLGETHLPRLGTLRIGVSLRELTAARERAFERVLEVALLAALFGFVSSYLLARQLAAPIERLERSADAIARGDLHQRAIVDRDDEIGRLGTSFNGMASSLERTFAQLNATVASFERFVPRKFLGVVAPNGIEHIQVGNAALRPMTILFSDIRGYTTISEGLPPMEVFAFLNEYLAVLGAEISREGGFIDKYIGDAIMALFEDAHTDGAVRAALGMQRSLVELNASRGARGLAPVATGIGIHRGEVVMGAVGFTDKIDSTVIGDAVNVASRVEGLTKSYATALLVTREVIAALEFPERFVVREVAHGVLAKGKGEPIDLFAIEQA